MDLASTEAVLAAHGNMSSVTVLFVLDEILRRNRPAPGALGLLGAFGPGFGAELSLSSSLSEPASARGAGPTEPELLDLGVPDEETRAAWPTSGS